jgi:toxin ParE1/3/4
MMKLRWTPEADEERFAIWAYIAEDNPQAAARMDELFSQAARQLACL